MAIYPAIIVSPTLYPISAANGGTGVASPTAHGVTIAEGASNFVFLAATNAYPLVGASGADPSFTPNMLGAVLTNPLAVPSGGTGLSAVPADNLLVGSGGGGLRAITVLNPAQGGSGVSSLTDHSVVVAHGSGAFSALIPTLSTLNYPVTSQGPASDPTFTNLHDNLQLNQPLAVPSGGIGVSAVAAHGILVGTGGGSLRVAVVSTAAYPLRSLGSAFDPDYRILGADGGGTGHTVLPTGAVLLGNSTNLRLQYAEPKQAGFVLTDNGPGQLSSFQAASSSGSSGTATLPAGMIVGGVNLTTAPASNMVKCDGTAYNRVTLSALNTLSKFTQSCTTVNTSTNVTTGSTVGLAAGQAIEGTGIPVSTTISSITNATTFVISHAATVSATNTLTFYPFGNGDSSTTFNVPKITGRVPLMYDSAASLITGYTGLGAAGGEQLHALTLAELAVHSHTASTSISSPSHTHGPPPGGTNFIDESGGKYSGTGGDAGSGANTAGSSTGDSAGTTVNNAGSGTSHNTMQPSVAIIYWVTY